jgi:signal transduction histidine kinase
MVWIRPFLPQVAGIDVVLATGPAEAAGRELTVILGVGRWARSLVGAPLAPAPALVRRLLRSGGGAGVADVEGRMGLRPARARGPAHRGRLHAWRLGPEADPPLLLVAAFRRTPAGGFSRAQRDTCNRVALGVAAGLHRSQLLAAARGDAERLARVLQAALDLNASLEPDAVAGLGSHDAAIEDGEARRAVAAMAETALRNAQLYADSVAARRQAGAAAARLQLAVEVAVDLASASPHAPQVAARLLRGVGRAVSADRGVLYQVAGEQALVLDSFDADGDAPRPGSRLPASALPPPPDGALAGRPAPYHPSAPGVHHGLVLPLPEAGDPPTLIALGRRRDEPFQADDVAAAGLLQGIGGVGMRNAALFSAAEDARGEADRALRALVARGRQEETLAELGRAALAGAPEQALLEDAVRAVAGTLPADLVRVTEPVPGRRSAVLRAGVGWAPEERTVPVVEGGELERVLEGGGALATGDLAAETRFAPSPRLVGHGVASLLSVPIGTGPRALAELGAFSRRRHAFGPDALGFVLRVAQLLDEAMLHSRNERALRESLASLRRVEEVRRALLARLVRVVEEERDRIAADMHDDVLQAMAASTLRLQLVREGAGPGHHAVLDRLVGGLDRSVERLRGLVFELRADALEDGLARALEHHLAHDPGSQALAHRIVDDLARQPSPHARLVLYRIAQEALLNVRKHAGASSVEIRLQTDGAAVRMRIGDDGAGFEPGLIDRPSPGHLGLLAMRERAELAGGRLTVDSVPGGGTVVDVWLPAEPGDGR